MSVANLSRRKQIQRLTISPLLPPSVRPSPPSSSPPATPVRPFAVVTPSSPAIPVLGSFAGRSCSCGQVAVGVCGNVGDARASADIFSKTGFPGKVINDAAVLTECRDVHKSFGGQQILRVINFKMKARTLQVWKLGVVNYSNALKLQEKLLASRKSGDVPDLVLSLQHPPTYTLGKRRTDHNLLISEPQLKDLGAELHYTDRGGDITFHGPRQAVLYPIFSLRDIGFGARMYVEGLESTMIRVCSLYGVKASPGGPGETGVWVGDRKIGAIGVRISSGYTCHGLAFNIDPDLEFFKHIVPCGIPDKQVTSLRMEAKMELPSDEVIHDQLIEQLARSFHFDTVDVKQVPGMNSCSGNL